MSTSALAQRLFSARSSSGVPLDAALAAVMLAASLALLSHGGIDTLRTGSDGSGSGTFDLLGVALTACSTIPLIAWRRFPLGVFAATLAANVLMIGLDYPLDLLLGPVAALYLLAASRDRESPWTRRATTIVAGLLVGFLAASILMPGGFAATELLHNGLACAVAWFAGERTRLRREQIAELRIRALRTEQGVERERLLAVAEERTRIARDLHDSAGHAISVIAVRAGAARLRHPQDPDRSLPALVAIEELARQTVEEIDHIVTTLREDGPGYGDVEAQPGLASLDTLITHHAATVDTTGVPRPLGGAADQAAYRILQEALTNAARHGTGNARIELAFEDAALQLTVTNRALANCPPRSGGGHGLVGMHQRATLLGGSLDTESAGGRFRLRARIPYTTHRS
ncbi:sensor histidine kinase [Nonomuraea sp. 10N515B]|uniref:sensor histidine kinase n=1 Tax=Nonomuraea sp. 10N515B TaxID=3457422 RepID=UPI003FCC6E80